MLSIGTDTELITELKNIFGSIAPSVQIFSSSTPRRFDLKSITPAKLDGYSITSWQHLGFGLPMYTNIYKSIKLNIPYRIKDNKSQEQLFKTRAKIGEYLKTDIVKGISCIVPYALYSKQRATYTTAAPLVTQELMREMGNVLPKDSSGKLSLTGSFPEIRLADVIIAWNILKHSYPYWNDASLPAETILSDAIKKSISDNNPEDFLKYIMTNVCGNE